MTPRHVRALRGTAAAWVATVVAATAHTLGGGGAPSPAFVVAVVGIMQQVVGEARLLDFGYSYDGAIRTIDGRLRSFGTMDEPFAYAAFAGSIDSFAVTTSGTISSTPAGSGGSGFGGGGGAGGGGGGGGGGSW